VKQTSLMNHYKRVTRPVAKRLLLQGEELFFNLFNGAITETGFTSASQMDAYELNLSQYYRVNYK
jgi:hypothetical protein